MRVTSSIFSAGLRSTFLGLLFCGMSAASAQPADSSGNRFGDRQAGHWGDPGQGHFGNPAAGNFDNDRVLEPAPGTRALGTVYTGKAPQASPYISLTAPVDAAPETKEPKKVVKKPGAKPAKKASN
jgi:hypothetical protein